MAVRLQSVNARRERLDIPSLSLAIRHITRLVTVGDIMASGFDLPSLDSPCRASKSFTLVSGFASVPRAVDTNVT